MVAAAVWFTSWPRGFAERVDGAAGRAVHTDRVVADASVAVQPFTAEAWVDAFGVRRRVR